MSRINLWIVLLLISVLINGALLGAGARSWFGPEPTGAAHSERLGDPGPGRIGFNIRRFAEALPPETRQAARARFEAARPELRRLTLQAAQARRASAEALSADPFDPDAATEALDRAREARARVEARTEQIVLEVMADLPPEVRRRAFREAMGGPLRGDRPPGPPDGRRGPPRQPPPGG